MATPPTAFVSGHLDVTPAYFAAHYVPLLDRAIAANHAFVLGASAGADTLALQHLLARGVPAARIAVYVQHSEAAKFAPKLRDFAARGGTVVVTGKSHTERDEACTRASHYDLLRYRTDAEARALYGPKWRKRVSGTEKNELRRRAGVGLRLVEEAAAAVEEEAAAVPEERVERTEHERKIRGLQRKIEQARKLRERIEKGEALEKTQAEKAGKVEAWEEELAVLRASTSAS